MDKVFYKGIRAPFYNSNVNVNIEKSLYFDYTWSKQ